MSAFHASIREQQRRDALPIRQRRNALSRPSIRVHTDQKGALCLCDCEYRAQCCYRRFSTCLLTPLCRRRYTHRSASSAITTETTLRLQMFVDSNAQLVTDFFNRAAYSLCCVLDVCRRPKRSTTLSDCCSAIKTTPTLRLRRAGRSLVCRGCVSASTESCNLISAIDENTRHLSSNTNQTRKPSLRGLFEMCVCLIC